MGRDPLTVRPQAMISDAALRRRREGYGFLRSKDGRDIYFHRRSVLNDAFDELEEGAEVRYVEEAGDQGAQASTVAVAGK